MVKAQLPIQKYAKKTLLIKEVGSKFIKARLETAKDEQAFLLNGSWISMARAKILKSYAP